MDGGKLGNSKLNIGARIYHNESQYFYDNSRHSNYISGFTKQVIEDGMSLHFLVFGAFLLVAVAIIYSEHRG